jgi:hypothetical protein
MNSVIESDLKPNYNSLAFGCIFLLWILKGLCANGFYQFSLTQLIGVINPLFYIRLYGMSDFKSIYSA